MKKYKMRYNGSLEELNDTILKKSKELGKDIIVDTDDKAKLMVGFLRGGHSGGRWFVADVSEKGDEVEFSGFCKYIENCRSKYKIVNLLNDLFVWLLIYGAVLLAVSILWLLTVGVNYLYLMFLIPIPIIIIMRICAVVSSRKTDKEFIEGFMADEIGCKLLEK